MPGINLRRTHLVLRPDPRRVLARPLNLADEQRVCMICRRVMALPEPEVRALLDQVDRIAPLQQRSLKLFEDNLKTKRQTS